MQAYLNLLQHVRTNGVIRMDRTGIGTQSIFGYQMRFDLSEGFPLLTTKKLHLKSIIHELLWFLTGDTNAKTLNNLGVKIWDAWADKNGDLGPIYGYQWRSWPTHSGEGIDQIANLVDELKNNPEYAFLDTMEPPSKATESKIQQIQLRLFCWIRDNIPGSVVVMPKGSIFTKKTLMILSKLTISESKIISATSIWPVSPLTTS